MDDMIVKLCDLRAKITILKTGNFHKVTDFDSCATEALAFIERYGDYIFSLYAVVNKISGLSS